MKVSVNFEDSVIAIDGKPISFEKGEVIPPIDDATLEPKPWQVLQWENISGYAQIERRENEFVGDFDVIHPYIELYQLRAKQLEDEKSSKSEG